MKIIMDTLGGDKSPSANVDGVIAALAKYPDLSVILTGEEDPLREATRGGLPKLKIHISAFCRLPSLLQRPPA